MSCPGFGAKYSAGNESRTGCDTWFASDRFFINKWQKIDNAKILIDTIKSTFDEIGYKPHIVITGGEPLLYHNDRVFLDVVKFLINENLCLTFETNGTVFIDFSKFPVYKECIFALSVKLSNSMEPEQKRIVPEALRSISVSAREYFLKFTIDSDSIIDGIETEIERIRGLIPSAEVYCMPLGHDKKTLEKNDKAVFEFCVRHNYTYCDRLHIRIFNTSKGV